VTQKPDVYKVLRSNEEILASNTEFWQLYSALFHICSTYLQADTLYKAVVSHLWRHSLSFTRI